MSEDSDFYSPEGDPQAAVSVAINPADVRFSAMNFLARREHSLHELRQKLKRRFDDDNILDAVLERLVAENLQSDQRFAESFARHRSDKGYGPARVKQEMRERGLSKTEIAEAIERAEVDWYDLAEQAYRRKFGRSPIVDIKDKAKRIRFMQYRGFSGDHYDHLLRDHATL